MQPNGDDILEKYNKELQNYADAVFPGFPRYMENHRGPFLPFLKRLFDFYLFCSYLVDSGLFPDEERYQPLRILYAKASLSLFGIYSCLSNGLLTEASVLLRSLFEAYLNVKLILECNTDERLRLYSEFQHVEQWNNLQAHRNLVSEGKLSIDQFRKSFSDDLVREVDLNFSRVKESYHPTQPYHWAWKIFRDMIKQARNPTISYIADHLGLSLEYVKLYGPLSISVHNSPSLVHQVSKGADITLAPQFTKTIYNNGALAVDYVAHIVVAVVRYFGFRDSDEIVVYTTAFADTLGEHESEKNSGAAIPDAS